MDSMSNLAIEMEEDIESEKYMPDERRKSRGKTIPVGGGRTADTLMEWTHFSEDVMAYWEDVRLQLANIPVGKGDFPKRAYHARGNFLICDEAEVRGACHVSIFGIVNMAAESLGLGIQINATSSNEVAKSQVDMAGFVTVANKVDEYEAVALPIEVKGRWQFMLDASNHICYVYESTERHKVINGLSQVYYYMVVEGVQFGVICSKEQHIFFQRSADPSDKTLYASRTVNHSDRNPSVRQCYLYMLAKAKEGDTVSASQVPLTEPSQKWIRVSNRGRGSQIGGHNVSARGMAGHRGKAGLGNGGAGSSSQGNNWAMHQDAEVKWLLNLEEFDVEDLYLGKVIKHGRNCIVREGRIGDLDVCIKIFEFFERYDHLSSFKTEVETYKRLLPLQGLVIPRLTLYGTVWGRCVGFVATKKEGQSLSSSQCPALWPPRGLQNAFSSIHAYNVVHNDVHVDNIVVSSPYNEVHPFKIIDFGSSVLDADQDDLAWEQDHVISFCRKHWMKKTKERLEEDSEKFRSFEFDVNKD